MKRCWSRDRNIKFIQETSKPNNVGGGINKSMILGFGRGSDHNILFLSFLGYEIVVEKCVVVGGGAASVSIFSSIRVRVRAKCANGVR